jgi:hypothetical protein
MKFHFFKKKKKEFSVTCYHISFFVIFETSTISSNTDSMFLHKKWVHNPYDFFYNFKSIGAELLKDATKVFQLSDKEFNKIKTCNSSSKTIFMVDKTVYTILKPTQMIRHRAPLLVFHVY